MPIVRSKLNLAVLSLLGVAAVLTVAEGEEHGEPAIGIAIWGVFVAASLCLGALIGGAAIVVWPRSRRRSSRQLLTAGIVVAMTVLLPVPMRWTSDEIRLYSTGLVPAIQAAALALGFDREPQFRYTETCCV